MTVLVSVTYYPPAAPYVRRAVESVLAQTYTDLVCVVIGDGAEPPLDGIRDDRLIVHTYPVNRGAYFAQDVAIWASPYEWYAPVAADDWIDPEHIEKLLAQGGDRCSGGVRAHNDRYCPGHHGHRDCTGTLSPPDWKRGARKPFEVGIYRTFRYTEIGAHNPAERIGQDSLTLAVQRIVAPVGVSGYITYNRLNRPGSLCTDPATSRDSPARKAMKLRNGVIVQKCRELRSAPRIKAYRESLVPHEVRDALAREVEGLRAKVGQAVAA